MVHGRSRDFQYELDQPPIHRSMPWRDPGHVSIPAPASKHGRSRAVKKHRHPLPQIALSVVREIEACIRRRRPRLPGWSLRLQTTATKPPRLMSPSSTASNSVADRPIHVPLRLKDVVPCTSAHPQGETVRQHPPVATPAAGGVAIGRPGSERQSAELYVPASPLGWDVAANVVHRVPRISGGEHRERTRRRPSRERGSAARLRGEVRVDPTCALDSGVTARDGR